MSASDSRSGNENENSKGCNAVCRTGEAEEIDKRRSSKERLKHCDKQSKGSGVVAESHCNMAETGSGDGAGLPPDSGNNEFRKENVFSEECVQDKAVIADANERQAKKVTNSSTTQESGIQKGMYKEKEQGGGPPSQGKGEGLSTSRSDNVTQKPTENAPSGCPVTYTTTSSSHSSNNQQAHQAAESKVATENKSNEEDMKELPGSSVPGSSGLTSQGGDASRNPVEKVPAAASTDEAKSSADTAGTVQDQCVHETMTTGSNVSTFVNEAAHVGIGSELVAVECSAKPTVQAEAQTTTDPAEASNDTTPQEGQPKADQLQQQQPDDTPTNIIMITAEAMAELNASNEGDVVINASDGGDSKLFFVFDGKGNCKLLNADEVDGGNLSANTSTICTSDIGNETTVIQLLVNEANNNGTDDASQLKQCAQNFQHEAASYQQNPPKSTAMPDSLMPGDRGKSQETYSRNKQIPARLATEEAGLRVALSGQDNPAVIARANAELARAGYAGQTRGYAPTRGRRRSSAIRRRQGVSYPRVDSLTGYPYPEDAGWGAMSSARGFYPNEMLPGMDPMPELCDVEGDWAGFSGAGYEDMDLLGPEYSGYPGYRGDVGYSGYPMDPTSCMYGFRGMAGKTRRRRGRGRGRGGVRQYLQHRLLWARYTGRSQEALKRVLNAIKQKCSSTGLNVDGPNLHSTEGEMAGPGALWQLGVGPDDVTGGYASLDMYQAHNLADYRHQLLNAGLAAPASMPIGAPGLQVPEPSAYSSYPGNPDSLGNGGDFMFYSGDGDNRISKSFPDYPPFNVRADVTGASFPYSAPATTPYLPSGNNAERVDSNATHSGLNSWNGNAYARGGGGEGGPAATAAAQSCPDVGGRAGRDRQASPDRSAQTTAKQESVKIHTHPEERQSETQSTPSKATPKRSAAMKRQNSGNKQQAGEGQATPVKRERRSTAVGASPEGQTTSGRKRRGSGNATPTQFKKKRARRSLTFSSPVREDSANQPQLPQTDVASTEGNTSDKVEDNIHIITASNTTSTTTTTSKAGGAKTEVQTTAAAMHANNGISINIHVSNDVTAERGARGTGGVEGGRRDHAEGAAAGASVLGRPYGDTTRRVHEPRCQYTVEWRGDQHYSSDMSALSRQQHALASGTGLGARYPYHSEELYSSVRPYLPTPEVLDCYYTSEYLQDRAWPSYRRYPPDYQGASYDMMSTIPLKTESPHLMACKQQMYPEYYMKTAENTARASQDLPHKMSAAPRGASTAMASQTGAPVSQSGASSSYVDGTGDPGQNKDFIVLESSKNRWFTSDPYTPASSAQPATIEAGQPVGKVPPTSLAATDSLASRGFQQQYHYGYKGQPTPAETFTLRPPNATVYNTVPGATVAPNSNNEAMKGFARRARQAWHEPLPRQYDTWGGNNSMQPQPHCGGDFVRSMYGHQVSQAGAEVGDQARRVAAPQTGGAFAARHSASQ